MKAAIDKAKGDKSSVDFDLPEWPTFVGIMPVFPGCQEALASLAFLTKEMSFRGMVLAGKTPTII